MDSCSGGTEQTVFFGVFNAVTGDFGLPRHFVGDRLDAVLELNVHPNSAVNGRVTFKAVKFPQVFLCDDIKNALHISTFFEIDVGIEPFYHPWLRKTAPPRSIAPGYRFAIRAGFMLLP